MEPSKGRCWSGTSTREWRPPMPAAASLAEGLISRDDADHGFEIWDTEEPRRDLLVKDIAPEPASAGRVFHGRRKRSLFFRRRPDPRFGAVEN